MSLFTKYRSQTFDDLVEQDSVKNILKNQVIKIASGWNKLSNYIFFGPRWTGKTSVARIFAKAINCLHNTDWNPCNNCDNCNLINAGRSLDIVEIDAASHTWVDNIREEIIAKASYQPSTLRKKVYIIDEAHMLSKSAFNALLKIIEEPPEYLVFILATTDPQKILDTIKSRCQLFGFKNITTAGIIWQLKFVCSQESINYDDVWLQLIAKVSAWWMRDALKYLDQVSWVGDITEDNVIQSLGIVSDAAVIDFIKSYEVWDIASMYAQIDKISESWWDITNFVKDLWQYIDHNISSDSIYIYSTLIQIIRWYFENIRLYPFPSTVIKSQITSNFKNINTWPSSQQLINNRDNLTIDNKNDLMNANTSNNKLSTPEEVAKIIPASIDIPKSEIINDISKIRQYIIDNSSSVIKWIREKQCEINGISDDILHVGVISSGSIQILNMKKSETEKILSNLLGKHINISYNSANSEDLLDSILSST